MSKSLTSSRHSTISKFNGRWLLCISSIILIITWKLVISFYNQQYFGTLANQLFDYSQFTIVEDNHGKDPVGDPIGQPTINPSTNHLHHGSHAMVSSDIPICSTLGKNILLKGGNAADAAITVALCIGSINLHLSGIGGGCYIVSSNEAKNETISIDAREMAPQLSFKNMFNAFPVLSQIGGLAVAVPGELKGLNELYDQHGSGNLKWSELIEPVIELNFKGWQASKIWINALNKMSSLVFSRVPILSNNWDFIFSDKANNKLLQEGDYVRRIQYGKTLSLIAKNESSDIFYDPQGPIIPHLVKTVNQLGGIISEEDFENYKIEVEPAIEFEFTANDEKFKLYTSGGSSSGLALTAGINLYNQVESYEGAKDNEYLSTHRLIESMKWIASARSYFGLSNNKTMHKELISKYTSSEWSQAIIDNNRYNDSGTFPWKNYGPKFEINEPHGTSHFSIADGYGNAVGITTTVNLLFGSMVYDNNTGIILNDEMDDFSTPNISNAFNLTPSIYNYIEPGKRPLSSMSPTIIKKSETNEIEFVIGAAGGSRIPTAILQAIIRYFYRGMKILDIISFPRLHHQLIPEYVMVENISLFNEEHSLKNFKNIKEYMSNELGHSFIETGALTAMNAIGRCKGNLFNEPEQGWYGVSDFWRKRGESDGY